MRRAGLAGLVLAVAAFALVAAAGVRAEQGNTNTGASRILNIELKDTPIKGAIDSIFRGTGLKYYIRPGVSGKVVELKLTGVTVEQAISALAEAAQLTVKIEDGAYIIAPGPKTAGPAYAPKAREQEQPGSQEPKGTVQTQGGNTAQAIINQPPSSPVYYGQPGPYNNPYAYGYGGGYPNAYQFGQLSILGGYPPVVVAGGNPYILQRGPLVPPPPGYVGPDLLRFLRTQWAIQPRTYLSYPISAY